MIDTTKIGCFVQSSPHPAWLATSNGHCTYANPALERLTGLRWDQIIHADWRNFLLEEDRPAASSSWQSSLATGTPYRTRVRMRGFDGLPVTVELIAFGNPVEDRSELWMFTALHVHGTIHQHPPLEAQLQSTLNVIPAHTWYAAPSGSLTFVNERLATFLGLSQDDPLRFGIDVGGSWDSHIPLLHPDDQEESRRVWSTCIRTGSAGEVSFRVRNAEGMYRWFLSRAEPLRASDGTLLYWIGVNLDIDDAKRAEEALNATKETLARATQVATVAELSASIAHEISQPLSALVANARAALNWLSRDNPNVGQARSLMEAALRDGMGMGNIIREIRQLFKRQAPNKSTVHLNDLINQVLLVLGKDLRDKDTTLLVEIDKDLPPVQADSVQIQQVLLNLIRNATEAFPPDLSEPRKLLIRTFANSSQNAVVEVVDNGVGIPDSEKIFEAFFTTKKEGLGIGLAISRSIVEAHGGTLVASNRSDSGACFSLTLPFEQLPKVNRECG
jgi:PAS domain S-box-containing protein